jgi:hypothetical protein
VNKFSAAIQGVLKRGGMAFVLYPASMIFAAALAIVSIWRIYQEPINNEKLVNSLQLSFALGVIAGMALIVMARKISDKKIEFLGANLLTLLISTGTFFAIYLPSGGTISENSTVRVIAAMAISFLVFLIAPTFHGKLLDYNRMVFMTIKSFFIALVYGLVLMLGFFFVAFAVQQLLISDLTDKTYSYIAIISGLLAYAIFLGYFPQFKKIEEDDDPTIEKLSKQPKFAEVLFQNIMIPILAALTLVLIIWSLRILFTGNWPAYEQIIGIFTAYSLFGILLYLLVSSFNTLAVRLYRKIIPIATLVFLAFEAYSIVTQIKMYGVKPLEYAIVFLWIYAMITSILFLFLPISKNKVPSYIAIVLITIFVLPVVGANDFSYTYQGAHLKSILTKNGMISGDSIKSNSGISEDDKMRITLSTNYLYDTYSSSTRTLPGWLKQSMNSTVDFKKVFGFDMMFGRDGNNPDNGNPSDVINLTSSPEAISTTGYDYHIPQRILMETGEALIKTEKGDYTVLYTGGKSSGPTNSSYPEITVVLGGKDIAKFDLKEFADGLYTKYSGTNSQKQVAAEDFVYMYNKDNVKLKIVFNAVTLSKSNPGTNYFDLTGIYFGVK